IIAMVCSSPPAGFERWTVQLVLEESKKRGIIKSAGWETIRTFLQENDIKPWRKKNVVHSRAK
ncbi:helix-turn-helix domain-containing protein, partial [Candidatus Riflebacteria bacterium]